MVRRLRVPAAILAVVALVALTVAVPTGSPTRTIVAHFASTVGIHEGSDVRVLGVKIGEVVSVRPEGRTVRVELRYDPRYPVPADAMAAIIPPSVVSDRYVQLLPAYAGGPTLADGADLPLERTAVPLELDDIYRSLDEFNKALGPNGANKNGALGNLVGTGAANLKGNGQNLATTLDGFAKTLGTLSDGKDDLFGSVVNLQQFVTALAESDAQVKLFNQQLATTSEQLAGESDDLAATLRNLATALADITGFVRDNREALKSNVDGLTDLTGILVRQQQAIIDVLNVAPLALSNLNLAYNARSGTLDTRDDALGPYDPASYVCSLIVDLVPVNQVPKECVALAQTLNASKVPLPNQLRKLLGLPPVSPSPGGTLPGTPGAGPPGVPGTPPPSNDPTLGGILGGVL
jgi:virulence factor Mce-like protein